MENKALKTVEKYNMLSYGDKIVIGLSGGADSSALFHFLVTLREKYGLTIIACHVNHMLRGAEADRDESFVRSLCESEGVEFKLLRVDVAAIAQRNKESTEKCGRDIRYAFFDEIASSCGGKIATAHTASDNAETVLFNMTRGCGIKGLCGIPPVRDNIIRPLIEVTRSEIEEYCNRNGLKYVDDSTNFTREYTRNKLRLDVVKVLKEINPSFEATVSAMSDRMRIQAEHLDSIARSIMNDAYTDKGYKANLLYSTDEAVFSEVISILCRKYDIIPEASHISLIRAICASHGAVELKRNIFAVSNQGFLRIIKKEEQAEKEIIPFDSQESIVINNKKFVLSDMNIEEFYNRKKNNKIIFNNSLDYDTIPLSAVFRSRESGDIICLRDRMVSKTLKKLFNEMKIPKDERKRVVVFASDSEILWTEKTGVSEKHKITQKTKRVLVISPVSDEKGSD